MCLWKTPSISTDVTARELTPSTESKEPNSPILGGSDDWKNKNYGTKSVQINKNSSSSSDTVSNGGWSL